MESYFVYIFLRSHFLIKLLFWGDLEKSCKSLNSTKISTSHSNQEWLREPEYYNSSRRTLTSSFHFLNSLCFQEFPHARLINNEKMALLTCRLKICLFILYFPDKRSKTRVDRTVVYCWQNQLSQMTDFPPLLTFLNFWLITTWCTFWNWMRHTRMN